MEYLALYLLGGALYISIGVAVVRIHNRHCNKYSTIDRTDDVIMTVALWPVACLGIVFAEIVHNK